MFINIHANRSDPHMLIGRKMETARGNNKSKSKCSKNKIVVQSKKWTVFLQSNVSKV